MPILLLIILLASGCKPKLSNNQLKTLDNYAAGARLRGNECSLEPRMERNKFPQLLAGRIKFDSAESAQKNATNRLQLQELQDEVLWTATALPQEALTIFAALGGIIRVRDNAEVDRVCRKSMQGLVVTQDVLSEGLTIIESCVRIYLLESEKNNSSIPRGPHQLEILVAANKASIRHGLVRAFGFAYGDFFMDSKPIGQIQGVPVLAFTPYNPLSSHTAERMAIAAGFLRDLRNLAFVERNNYLQRYGLTNFEPGETAASRVANHVFAEAFDSFFCRPHGFFDEKLATAIAKGTAPREKLTELKNTRETFRVLFPSTYASFTKSAARLFPSAVAPPKAATSTFSLTSSFKLNEESGGDKEEAPPASGSSPAEPVTVAKASMQAFDQETTTAAGGQSFPSIYRPPGANDPFAAIIGANENQPVDAANIVKMEQGRQADLNPAKYTAPLPPGYTVSLEGVVDQKGNLVSVDPTTGQPVKEETVAQMAAGLRDNTAEVSKALAAAAQEKLDFSSTARDWGINSWWAGLAGAPASAAAMMLSVPAALANPVATANDVASEAERLYETRLRNTGEELSPTSAAVDALFSPIANIVYPITTGTTPDGKQVSELSDKEKSSITAQGVGFAAVTWLGSKRPDGAKPSVVAAEAMDATAKEAPRALVQEITTGAQLSESVRPGTAGPKVLPPESVPGLRSLEQSLAETPRRPPQYIKPHEIDPATGKVYKNPTTQTLDLAEAGSKPIDLTPTSKGSHIWALTEKPGGGFQLKVANEIPVGKNPANTMGHATIPIEEGGAHLGAAGGMRIDPTSATLKVDTLSGRLSQANPEAAAQAARALGQYIEQNKSRFTFEQFDPRNPMAPGKIVPIRNIEITLYDKSGNGYVYRPMVKP